jgi:G:T-mismatch repair DNA endonuclease (very short patch repair protein)
MESMTKPHGNKGRKQSPEHIAARVAARKAKGYRTVAHKAAMETPEYRAKQAANMRRRWEQGEFADRKPHKHSPETIEKMREIRRQMWVEGRYADMKPATRRAVSEMERSLAPYLAKLGYRHTEERDCFISCEDRTRMPDYVDTEGRRVFEFFGCFWHHPDDEQVWIEQYAKKGWECTVLWEDELRDWLEQHQDLVDPETHEAAMKTSRARHRYPQRGNDQIDRASTAL